MEELGDTLISVELCETSLIHRNGPIEQERRAAIRDLLTTNYFHVPRRKGKTYQGPYFLKLGIEEDRMIMIIEGQNKTPLEQFAFSLKPFKRVIKEYFLICESYNKALIGGSLSKIELLDISRRSTHNEGAEIFKTRIKDMVQVNLETSRRLFTLICVLHFR